MEVLVFFSFRSVSKVPVNYQSNCRWIERFGGGSLKAPIKFFFSSLKSLELLSSLFLLTTATSLEFPELPQHFLIGGMRNLRWPADWLRPATSSTSSDSHSDSRPRGRLIAVGSCFTEVLPATGDKCEKTWRWRITDSSLSCPYPSVTGSRGPFSGADELLREECLRSSWCVYVCWFRAGREGFVARMCFLHKGWISPPKESHLVT